jgi:hypothetical protein
MKQLQNVDYAQRIHRKSIQKSLPEMARFLDETLTRGLLMYMIDVKDPKTITRWMNGEVATIRNLETEKRLRALDQIVELLLLVDEPSVFRGWFLGMNDILDDVSPAETIHNGHLQKALTAARGYVAMNW